MFNLVISALAFFSPSIRFRFTSKRMHTSRRVSKKDQIDKEYIGWGLFIVDCSEDEKKEMRQVTHALLLRVIPSELMG